MIVSFGSPANRDDDQCRRPRFARRDARGARLQKSQRKPSASSGGMNLARREATRSAVDSPMPVHDLDLANSSPCWALVIVCRNERSTGSGLIRPLNKRRRSLVMLAHAGSSSTGRSSRAYRDVKRLWSECKTCHGRPFAVKQESRRFQRWECQDLLSHKDTRRLDNQLHLANDQILRKVYTRYTCFYSRPYVKSKSSS
jgi:hypothetical protein